MSVASVEALIAAEERLNRSFAACLGLLLANLGWAYVDIKTGMPGMLPRLVSLGLVALQWACYVWFAVSAGAAAKRLGEKPWKYVVWILAAPFLAMIPIPIVSTLIRASPLSVKFLLGGQLQSAIREQTLAD
jgi:hypothetical protein